MINFLRTVEIGICDTGDQKTERVGFDEIKIK